MPDVDVFRVWAWNTKTMSWTMRGEPLDTVGEAVEVAEALQHKGLRVRVVPSKKYVVPVAPPIINATREFRQQQAGRMIELADANKRYKSPG
jgi:hypothetical protein